MVVAANEIRAKGGGADGGSGWGRESGGWLVPSDTNPPWQPN